MKKKKQIKTGMNKENSSQNINIANFKSPLEKAAEIFAEFEYYYRNKSTGNSDCLSLYARDVLEKIVLTPKQIDEFLQTKLEKNKQIFYSLELYISKLIQESYDAGYNDFEICAGEKPFAIGYGLKATEKKPIIIKINSKSGNFCFKQSSNIKATFVEDAGEGCMAYSENSYALFKKNVGDYCGHNSKYLYAVFKGRVGKHCGSCSIGMKAEFNDSVDDSCGDGSTDMIGTFNGDVCDLCGANSTNFTFKSKNEELCMRMLRERKKINVKLI